MQRTLIIFALTLVLAPGIFARPVGFKDAWSIISENSAKKNDLFSHYSPHPRFSLGARYIRFDQNEKDAFATLGQASLLLHRWNHEKFQANLYTFGGLGAANYKDDSGLAYLAGAQVDAEVRRLYSYFRFNSLFSSKFENQYAYRGRLGIAPYLADYDELNTWLMLQYDFQPSDEAEHSLTPFVRFFYKNILLEVGSSIRGEWMLNFITEI